MCYLALHSRCHCSPRDRYKHNFHLPCRSHVENTLYHTQCCYSKSESRCTWYFLDLECHADRHRHMLGPYILSDSLYIVEGHSWGCKSHDHYSLVPQDSPTQSSPHLQTKISEVTIFSFWTMELPNVHSLDLKQFHLITCA